MKVILTFLTQNHNNPPQKFSQPLTLLPFEQQNESLKEEEKINIKSSDIVVAKKKPNNHMHMKSPYLFSR